MNLRRTRAIARKEFLHILRDPRSLLMALALPVVMLMLFGYALTLDVDNIPIVIYDADGSPDSREVAALFEGSRYFNVVERAGYSRIIDGIDHNRILLGVVVPESYSEDLAAGRQASIQLLVDGSDSNTASIALGYAQALLEVHALDLRSRWLDRTGGAEMKPPVEPRLRIWYNSELKSKNYIVPGLIAVILMIIAALLTSLTIAREWEMGTMEQLLSTPLRPTELVLGKLVAFFAVGFTDTVVSVAVGVLVFDVPFRGSWVFLFLSVCVFLFGALCWGIMLSALARSQLLAYQAGMLTSFLPAFLLSGFIYDISTMPAIVRLVTYIFPARYLIALLKGVFLKGIGPEILALEVVFLVVYASVVFGLTVRTLRRKVV